MLLVSCGGVSRAIGDTVEIVAGRFDMEVLSIGLAL
jgi:hypothetical protein